MSIKFKSGKSSIDVQSKLSTLLKANKKVVAVGILKDFNSKYEDGENVVDVAILNEFGGTSKIDGNIVDIPSRPFMRQTKSKNTFELNRLRKALVNKMISGKISLDDSLNKLGIFYSNAIKYTIQHGEFVPNHPLTIKRKGAGKRPLIDTKRMLNSVNYKIRSKNV